MVKYPSEYLVELKTHLGDLRSTGTKKYSKHRLQLKRGLFQCGHHPNMHEMVSGRSSWAENWTDLRKNSMRVFFGSKKYNNKKRTRLQTY